MTTVQMLRRWRKRLSEAFALTEDVSAAYTVLRRDYEASWKRIHELLAENAELRREVHAHEDRQARVWSMAREMRRDAEAPGYVFARASFARLLDDYADVLTPPEAEEEET